jgi:hypothetical protein
VRASSLNDWNASNWWPHLVQAYSYVGMGTIVKK